jgi:hypothetical protein
MVVALTKAGGTLLKDTRCIDLAFVGGERRKRAKIANQAILKMMGKL